MVLEVLVRTSDSTSSNDITDSTLGCLLRRGQTIMNRRIIMYTYRGNKKYWKQIEKKPKKVISERLEEAIEIYNKLFPEKEVKEDERQK